MKDEKKPTKYHTVITAPNSNMKIAERGKVNSITYIYMTAHTFIAWYRHFNKNWWRD